MRIAILAFFFGTVVQSAPLPKMEKQPDYFPVKEGSVWEYESHSVLAGAEKASTRSKFTMTLSKVTVEKEVTKVIFESTTKTKVDRKEVFEIIGGEVIARQGYSIPKDLVIYKKGAKSGDKWSKKIVNGVSQQGVAESVVEELQTIEIGDKKHTCLVISHRLRYDGTDDEAFTTVFRVWLAPDVGIVKRENALLIGADLFARSTEELQEYKLTK